MWLGVLQGALIDFIEFKGDVGGAVSQNVFSIETRKFDSVLKDRWRGRVQDGEASTSGDHKASFDWARQRQAGSHGRGQHT
jgi:hypothetical protein